MNWRRLPGGASNGRTVSRSGPSSKALQASAVLGGNAVIIAGLLMALRYVSEMFLSPLGGRVADRYGVVRMLLLFSILSGLALAAFGSHWLILGASSVLVLRGRWW